MQLDREKINKAIELLIEGMGCDHTQEPYLGTPDRYYRFLEEVFGDDKNEVKTFPEAYTGPITITDHVAWSLCPHHLLPTKFLISVTYVPKQGRVLGLSKLPRLIDSAVKREGPALQERMTDHIVETLKPYARFVHVIVKGEHLCTKMRGVKTTGNMVTESRYMDPPDQPMVEPVAAQAGLRAVRPKS